MDAAAVVGCAGDGAVVAGSATSSNDGPPERDVPSAFEPNASRTAPPIAPEVAAVDWSMPDFARRSDPVADSGPHLDDVEANPHSAELLELLIHEQYFREELPHHLPDVFERVETSIKWAHERGYEPVFWQEGLLDALK